MICFSCRVDEIKASKKHFAGHFKQKKQRVSVKNCSLPAKHYNINEVVCSCCRYKCTQIICYAIHL